MLDLQRIATDHLKRLENDGTIKKAVEEGITRAITSAIDDQFRSYGALTQQINESIKEGLRIDPKQLDFPVYNRQMLIAIKQRLGQMFAGRAQDRFMEEMESVLEPAPAEMDISCLIRKIVGFWADEQADFFDGDVREYADVDLKADATERFYDLRMIKYRSELRLVGRREIHLMIRKNGEIGISHNLECNPTCLFGNADAFIFKLYAAGTKIVGMSEYYPDEHEDDFLIHDGSGCSC